MFINSLIIGSPWIVCIEQHLTAKINYIVVDYFNSSPSILTSSWVKGLQVNPTVLSSMHLSIFNMLTFIKICGRMTIHFLHLLIVKFLLFVVLTLSVKLLIWILLKSIKKSLIILLYPINWWCIDILLLVSIFTKILERNFDIFFFIKNTNYDYTHTNSF